MLRRPHLIYCMLYTSQVFKLQVGLTETARTGFFHAHTFGNEAQEGGGVSCLPGQGGLLKSSWRMRQGSVYYVASIRERLHACHGLFLPSLAVTRSQMNL